MTTELTHLELNAVTELQSLIRIPSITGNESELALYLAARLHALGADVVELVDADSGRPNVVACFEPAQGPGSDELILIGHMDTVTVDGWAEWWSREHPHDPRLDPFAGVVAEGAIWGRGASDVKGGIATILSAIERTRASEAGLGKRLIVAFVCDEESGEPGMGVSAGIKASLPRIRHLAHSPRLAVYVEPTTLRVYTSQVGFQIADVTIEGRSAYFGTPELGIDALQIAHQILGALWQHNAAITATHADPMLGVPNLLVTSISGGGPIAVPGTCSLSLIRKVLPSESMDEAQKSIQDAIASVPIPEGARVTVVFTAGRDHLAGGTPVQNDPTADGIAELVALVTRLRPDRADVGGAPYWSEAPLIQDALHAPCVYWAAGDIAVCHTPQERIDITDLLDSVSIMTEFLQQPWAQRT